MLTFVGKKLTYRHNMFFKVYVCIHTMLLLALNVQSPAFFHLRRTYLHISKFSLHYFPFRLCFARSIFQSPTLFVQDFASLCNYNESKQDLVTDSKHASEVSRERNDDIGTGTGRSAYFSPIGRHIFSAIVSEERQINRHVSASAYRGKHRFV